MRFPAGVRPALLTLALPLVLCCAGPRAARSGPDEPLLGAEDSYRETPVHGATRPPPVHLDEAPAAAAEVRGEPAAGPASPAEPEAAEAKEPAGRARGAVAFAGPRGTIQRGELIRVLDQNPAAFLRKVDSDPHFESGRFRGWSIKAFFAGDKRFSGIDLQRGDVVTRVNGRPIEQPDQFITVWQELRQARELRVEIIREGRPHVARWAIVD